jgi:hypothetical protein
MKGSLGKHFPCRGQVKTGNPQTVRPLVCGRMVMVRDVPPACAARKRISFDRNRARTPFIICVSKQTLTQLRYTLTILFIGQRSGLPDVCVCERLPFRFSIWHSWHRGCPISKRTRQQTKLHKPKKPKEAAKRTTVFASNRIECTQR